MIHFEDFPQVDPRESWKIGRIDGSLILYLKQTGHLSRSTIGSARGLPPASRRSAPRPCPAHTPPPPPNVCHPHVHPVTPPRRPCVGRLHAGHPPLCSPFVRAPPRLPVTMATEVKLFNRWSFEDVEVKDIALIDYIAVKQKYAVFLPHTAGRYNAKRFRKSQCPIVERLVCSLMMKGRNNGKKLI